MTAQSQLFNVPKSLSPFAARCEELGIAIATPTVHQIALAVVSTPFIAKRGKVFSEGTSAKEAALNLCEGIGIEFHPKTSKA